MKPSTSIPRFGKKTVILLLFCLYWMSSSSIYGKDTTVDNLSILVQLDKNGTANIKETWDIHVGSGISEWYLVQGNLGDIKIKDFKVTDEDGKAFIYEPRWIVDRSIEEKAGRCGMVDKGGNNYELCWGVGSEGKHQFTATYTLTNFVKSYKEADGFNHMFVARNISTPPEKIKLTIESPDTVFTSATTKIWSFGHKGEIHLMDGRIVAETTDDFIPEYAMIAMVRFEKGMFQPSSSIEKNFEEVLEEALNDSDYKKGSKTKVEDFEYAWMGYMFIFLENTFGEEGAGFIVLGLVALFFYLVYRIIKKCFVTLMAYMALLMKKLNLYIKSGNRRKVLTQNQPSEWYRGIPCNGDLSRANSLYNTLYPQLGNDYRFLIEAYILRLIQHGILELVQQPNAKGEIQTFIKVNPWQALNKDNAKDEANLSGLYNIFKEASGTDRTLQEKELKSWGRKHPTQLSWWYEKLAAPIDQKEKNKTDERQILGLRKFLNDFSLINERHVVEVQLWNEYLVFATLFGIADQVKKDFKKICPEYTDLLNTASRLTMNADTKNFIEDIATTTWTAAYLEHRKRKTITMFKSSSGNNDYSRSSGGGGRSSVGGGSGYSGGGSGGGGR